MSCTAGTCKTGCLGVTIQGCKVIRRHPKESCEVGEGSGEGKVYDVGSVWELAGSAGVQMR